MKRNLVKIMEGRRRLAYRGACRDEIVKASNGKKLDFISKENPLRNFPS
jgi:hypothetical protein